MQANDQRLYTCGCAAYNGNREARRKWFSTLAPLAKKAAVPYGVLPSLVLAKASLESGYGTDLYESEFYEPQYGIQMARKAKNHNNLMGMNAFPDNLRYLDWLKQPEWNSYRMTFTDYGPHFSGDEIRLAIERWKHYESIEDCFDDWCANMRWQAEAHNKPWGTTIEMQLLAIESYTPEGAKAKTPGMHFEWQDYLLYLYRDYDLGAYDREAYGMVEKMTVSNLDANVKRAYEYAHTHCRYGPTDRFFPPFEDGWADCVGLILRALYTMGCNHARHNINEIHALCMAAGLVRSDSEAEAVKRHCVVLMCPKGDRNNVAHVYYSLGGKDGRISKYDLGSDQRITSHQPFTDVPVNEWPDKRDFLCVYYVPDDKRPDEPKFRAECETLGTVCKEAGIYAGPGTAWRKLGAVKVGESVTLRGIVRNANENLWRAVRYGKTEGYIPYAAASLNGFDSYNGKVKGTDGTLAVRVSPGGTKVGDLKEGDKVVVVNAAEASDGSRWLCVKKLKMRGFVSAKYVKKI